MLTAFTNYIVYYTNKDQLYSSGQLMSGIILKEQRMDKILFNKFTCTLSLGTYKKKVGSKDALVLEYLIMSGNKGASKSNIISYAWQGLIVTDASLSKSISILRAALMELEPNEEIILTIPRVGYKIDPEKISLKISSEKEELENSEPESPESPESREIHIHPNYLKLIISALALIVFIIYTHKLVDSINYSDDNYMSPTVSREILPNNNEVFFHQSADRDFFRSVILNISCECLFFVSSNEQFSFISIYLKNRKSAFNFIFNREDHISMGNYIQDKISNGDSDD